MINIVSCVSTSNVHLSVGAFVNGFAVGGFQWGAGDAQQGRGLQAVHQHRIIYEPTYGGQGKVQRGRTPDRRKKKSEGEVFLKGNAWPIMFLLGLVLVLLACPALAAERPPDDDVEGLWLIVPDFPADVQTSKFSGNPIGRVEYIRIIDDGRLELAIERIVNDERSVTLNNITEFVKTRVKEEGGDATMITFEKGLAENLSEKLSYPCKVAAYAVGENEDARVVVSVFVFTEEYLFNVRASVNGEDSNKYGERVGGWLKGLAFTGELGYEENASDQQ